VNIMPRKRADAPNTEGTAEFGAPKSLDTNDARQNNPPASGTEREKAGRVAPASKTEAVQWALDDGVSSPTQIAEHVKAKYGMDITAAHVSTIKGNLKRGKGKGGKGKPGRKPGRKPKAAAPAVALSPKPAPKPAPPPAAAGLTSQDLASLAEIAERAGGIDELQEFLTAIQRIR
jgi:hypothetical protein